MRVQVRGLHRAAVHNYDSTANWFDLSFCVYPIPGCMDTAATNYEEDANIEPTAVALKCRFEFRGCTDSNALTRRSTGHRRPSLLLAAVQLAAPARPPARREAAAGPA